jgi:hypothetical protein
VKSLVTLSLFALVTLSSCAHAQPTTRAITELDPAIPESSGAIPSRRNPDLFWTHNDSGNPPELFAVDRKGHVVAKVTVAAKNHDWEDIAADAEGRVYIADIGDNAGQRKSVFVYRLPEPDAAHPPAGPVAVERTWELVYPDKPIDAEALFIRGDFGFVIDKRRDFGHARLFRFPLDAPAGQPVKLEHVADFAFRNPVTAADCTPDGKRLAVLSVGGWFVFDLADDPKQPAGFSMTVEAQDLFTDIHAEAICFDGPDGLLITSESRRMTWVKLPKRGP